METNKAISEIEYQLLSEYLIRSARHEPSNFIEVCGGDETGDALVQANIHLDIQNFISKNKRGVIKAPREFGKTIQFIYRLCYEVGQNLDSRHLIVSSSHDIAGKRVKAIRDILSSQVYKYIFPHIVQGRTWSDYALTVQRRIISPDATIEGCGLHSKTLGSRVDFLWMDDPDDEDVVVSETRRKRNIDRILNVYLPMISPQGRAFILCTPWHEADIANTLEKQAGWPSISFPVKNFKSPWGRRWSTKALQEKKRELGSLAYARSYELIPMSTESAPIKAEYFKYWQIMPKLKAVGVVCDPANSLEPGSSYTAIGSFGLDHGNNVYLIDVMRVRVGFPELLKQIIQMADKVSDAFGMNPVIGVEKTAYQNAIVQSLKRESPYLIVGIKADKSKFIRASRLAVYCENGRVHLRGDVDSRRVHDDHKEVFDECVMYPASAHSDCIDMLGYGVELMVTQASKPMPYAYIGRKRGANK